MKFRQVRDTISARMRQSERRLSEQCLTRLILGQLHRVISANRRPTGVTSTDGR